MFSFGNCRIQVAIEKLSWLHLSLEACRLSTYMKPDVFS
jgi:hypothetical protein